jgi:hypothetical protein
LFGSFTTLFFNKKKPTQLFCLRYNNPISSYFDNDIQSFFHRGMVFLGKTFGRAVISKPMAGQTGFVFDAEGIHEMKKVSLMTFSLCDKSPDNA